MSDIAFILTGPQPVRIPLQTTPLDVPVECEFVVRFKLFFAWYDCWVGWFWDRGNRILYVCPLPMVVLMFRFSESRKCAACKRRPGINEPRAMWGRLRHPSPMHIELGVKMVGVFCSRCGIADSDAGK